VKKLSFLSVLSVLLVPTVLLLIALPMGEDGMFGAFLNPIGLLFGLYSSSLDFDGPEPFMTILVLFPALPFLLIHLGMVLRKVIIKRKAAK
jgi:hypothetical protein